MATQRKSFTTPRGIAVFPKLNEPDTKFDNDGVYSVTLAFDSDDEDASALIRRLESLRDEQFDAFISENPKKKKVAKPAPVATPELDDDGEETGRILLKFKMKASGTSRKTGKRWEMQPAIFAGKQQLDDPPNIGGGSVLRVSFDTHGAFVESSKQFYLTLRLNAVQIIELRSFGQRSADDYGFDDEEDGYRPDDAKADSAPFEDADDSAEDDGDY